MPKDDHSTYPYVCLDKARFLEILAACLEADDLRSLNRRVTQLRAWVEASPVIHSPLAPRLPIMVSTDDADLQMRRDVLLEDLNQVLGSRTLQRAKYYITRLQRSVTEVRTSDINDINLNRWKEYDEILTDSLWVMDRRDTSGAHEAWYWGNFIPQIPRQMMLRYTRAGDWVLDPFAGSGTTLIECRRLGRHGLGIELNPEVAARASQALSLEPNPAEVTTEVVAGDSSAVDFRALLDARGIESVQFLMLHPPYHDIIQFSENTADLSNAPTLDAFVAQFATIVARATEVLAPERYLAVVIGDKYEAGAWVPLGFQVMQALLEQGHVLKSIVVKNFEGTRAKREQRSLWRYRALAGGFYVFRHEYLFVFQSTS